MALNRVVITGRGAVSPFGMGVRSFVEGIWAGDSAVRLMDRWRENDGLNSLIAAPVPEIDIKRLLSRNNRRTMGAMAVYATLAAREALEDAAVDEEMTTSGELGVAIGSTTGSPTAYEEFYAKYLPGKVLQEIRSGEFFKMMGHSCAANVCLTLGIRGEQWAPVSACTSSSQGIGLGYLLVGSGRQRFMICGGAEEVHPTVTGVFDLLRAASTRNDDPKGACRPFDRDRDGVVCGGGGGIVILEEYHSARERGAKIYGEIVGFGHVTDSGHIANPDQDSMGRAMQRAMSEAGLAPADIDYVNAHATGTELGDAAEAAAIGSVTGGDTPVSSLKGHLGHTLGAAGALELIGVLEMLERQEIIATRNLDNIDPRCNSANLLKEKCKTGMRAVLKNNFALGGVNTSMAIMRTE